MPRDIFLHILHFLHFADNYPYYMGGTMGSFDPSGNKHKYKINGKTQNLANVYDIVRMALRKNT